MRAVPLALLALLLAPGAAAQALTPSSATLAVTPPEAPIAPLSGVARLPVEMRTTCPASAATPEGITATFALVQLPRWATATLEPSQMRLDGASCLNGEASFQTLLEVRVTEDAPAFAPAPLEIEATAHAPFSQPATARAMAPIVAGFYSVIDVGRRDEVLRPDEDGLARSDLRVTHLGNGPARVLFEVGSVGPDLAVSPPRPVVLGARPSGGESSRHDVEVRVQRLGTSDLPSTFTLRYRSAYVLDPAILGDEGEIAFQVLPAGDLPDGAFEALADPGTQRDLPLGGLVLVAAALAIAALTRRR